MLFEYATPFNKRVDLGNNRANMQISV